MYVCIYIFINILITQCIPIPVGSGHIQVAHTLWFWYVRPPTFGSSDPHHCSRWNFVILVWKKKTTQVVFETRYVFYACTANKNHFNLTKDL